MLEIEGCAGCIIGLRQDDAPEADYHVRGVDAQGRPRFAAAAAGAMGDAAPGRLESRPEVVRWLVAYLCRGAQERQSFSQAGGAIGGAAAGLR